MYRTARFLGKLDKKKTYPRIHNNDSKTKFAHIDIFLKKTKHATCSTTCSTSVPSAVSGRGAIKIRYDQSINNNQLNTHSSINILAIEVKHTTHIQHKHYLRKYIHTMKFSPLCLLAVSSMTSIASAFLGSHTVPVSTCTGTGTGTRTTFYYSNSSLFANNNNNKVVRKPNSAVEITITAPCSATSAAFDKACSELSRTVNIPGFRKGAKIPPQVLESAMAAKGGRTALRAEAIKALVGELLESALKEEGVQPIGQPNLVISAEELAEKFVPGEEIDILVSCDVWPELKWKGDYKGLKASYERKSFDQAKFDKAIEDLRERYAETSKIEDPNVKLEMGNACTVNMVGYMSTTDGEKGEALPNAASGDNVEVVLGKGRYMEGLVEGLVGAGVGETKTVTVSFPQVR